MKFDWNNYKNKLLNSPNEVRIFEKHEITESSHNYRSFMEAVVNHVSHITINKYLRILGTSDSAYENIFEFTNVYRDIFGEEKYIIANDVFGGLFATERTVHYFAPDSLQWEDLGVNYEEFLEWIAEEDITEFYQSFLWKDYEEMVAKVASNEGIYVYPFYWSQECDPNTAFKKIVALKDILETNSQNMSLLDKSTNGNE